MNPSCSLLGSVFTLKMYVVTPSETLVSYCIIARRHNPEDYDTNLKCGENVVTRIT